MSFLLFLRSDFCISFWYWRIYVSTCRRLYFFLKIWRTFTSRFCFKNWISKTTIMPIKVTILQTMLSGFILLLALSANTPSPKLKEGDKRSYSRRYTFNLFPQLLEKIESLALEYTQNIPLKKSIWKYWLKVLFKVNKCQSQFKSMERTLVATRGVNIHTTYSKRYICKRCFYREGHYHLCY